MFLDERVIIRIRREELEQMRDLVAKNPNIYENVSHFLRIAVIKEIRFRNEILKKDPLFPPRIRVRNC